MHNELDVDVKKYRHIVCKGFKSLHQRIKVQEEQAKAHQGKRISSIFLGTIGAWK